MSIPRFYIPPAQWNPETLCLGEEESHHASEVLRLEPGNRVVAFNGAGIQALAEITSVKKKSVILTCVTLHKTAAPPARLTLCQAIPKGKNMDLIIEKATELGVSEIVPIISDRTVVRLDPTEAARKQEKWQRVVIEACKQCGQNWLPTVALPVTLPKFFAGQPTADLKLIAAIEEQAEPLKNILAKRTTPIRSALVCIGPEGDFTPAELNLAKENGCAPMTLGPIILRAETAAIYSVSVLAHELFAQK